MIYEIEHNGEVFTVEASSDQEALSLVTTSANQSEANDGLSIGTALLGGGLLAGGLALRNPMMRQKAFDILQGARHFGALSGLAVPKSIVGNVGAPFVAAAERKSLEPIKQFFSGRTAKDWLREIRDPEVGIAQLEPGGYRMWNPFGRMMSAGDVATRKALVRAGTTDSEAARYTLQTNLGELGLHGDVLKALESKPAKYGILYRRTPMNVLTHGANNIAERPGLSAISAGVGAVQGSEGGAASDPLAIAMTAPAAGVYSLPYLGGAALGKFLGTGSKLDAARVSRGLSPIPEDMSSFIDPVGPMAKPAAFSALQRLRNLLQTGKSF